MIPGSKNKISSVFLSLPFKSPIMRKFTFLSTLILPFISCNNSITKTPGNQAKTVEQLLTGNTWKADEIRVQLSDDTKAYYKRGGLNNTVNYNSDSLKFRRNNTGSYYYEGREYPVKWAFTDPEKTKMELIIYQDQAINIYLENIHFTDNHFKYTQYSSTDGISYMASGTRTPN